MKLWRLMPVVLFVGVLVAATVGFAATQNIDTDHNFAAEGEQAAKSCDLIEVEYGGDDGDVDRVKLSYPPGNNNQTNCGGEFAHVEIHNDSHDVISTCGQEKLDGTDLGGFAQTSFDPCSPTIKNNPNCTIGVNCVEDIDHINIVITDLTS